MRKLIDEFKSFAMRGNVIDLAVGIIIGGAFGKIVTSLVNDIVMPLLGLIIGRINFSSLKYVISKKSGSVEELSIKYGQFIQSIIDFLIIAFCIFLIIKLFNAFKKKEEQKAAVSTPSRQEQLLEEIRDLLKNK